MSKIINIFQKDYIEIQKIFLNTLEKNKNIPFDEKIKKIYEVLSKKYEINQTSYIEVLQKGFMDVNTKNILCWFSVDKELETIILDKYFNGFWRNKIYEDLKLC